MTAAITTGPPGLDPRLAGSWRSDRRRSLRFWKPKPGCSRRAERAFRGLFGKLVIRWADRWVRTELDGFTTEMRYELLAADADSVVVRTLGSDLWSGGLQHIHFVGDRYWVGVGGTLCEWFRRAD